ncbi:MAG: hypothetical protein AUH43_05870 [Acidobacteria bacterium 13_1_40CM_65_14]|nr:MAG: hypothetical protein AUH43_05870 [Acidobacteria bacterium 13_1_40CM_65_14]
MTSRGPQLQFRVSRRPHLQQIVPAAIVKLEAGDGLRVTAVEVLRQPQDRGERAHDAARAAGQRAETLVPPLRRRLTVIARHERDRFDLLRLEPAEIAVPDQIAGVFVVALIADVNADVMEDRGELQPLALAIGQTVNRTRLIEQCNREARDLLRMLRPVVAPFGQLVHAAPPDVRIPIRLRDLLAVPGDVIEHQTFTQ